MAKYRSSLLKVLDERGYIHQVTDAAALDALAQKDIVTHNPALPIDRVQLRLDTGQPMTLLAFKYMTLQAYDFLELSRRAGCLAQLGRSDQWGNIVNGIELGRRIDGTELYGVTTPLITN